MFSFLSLTFIIGALAECYCGVSAIIVTLLVSLANPIAGVIAGAITYGVLKLTKKE